MELGILCVIALASLGNIIPIVQVRRLEAENFSDLAGELIVIEKGS